MKFVTFILIVLLIAACGFGAYFFLYIHQPLQTEYEKMSAGMPELTRTRTELKKYRDRDARERGWMPAAVQTLRAGLQQEIGAGKAEVVSAGDRIVVNISEQVLYTTRSRIFSKNISTLGKLPGLLKIKGIEDKELLVGNMTASVPARGRGRRRVPAKDGRTLAGERSRELVKYLEKNGVKGDRLAAVAYPPKISDGGFKIKDHKTMIIIENPPVAAPETAVPKPAAAAAPAPQPKPTTAEPQPAAPQQVRPQPIPIQPAPPR